MLVRRRGKRIPNIRISKRKQGMKNSVPGDAPAPSVPVVDGREHEEELERHHSASRNGLVTDVVTSRMDK
jgi:hypothetical protein